MSKQEEYDRLTTEISDLRVRLEAIQENIQSKVKRSKQLFFEINRKNYDDFGWLIRNPLAPKSNETLREFIKNLYGEYKGPHPSGYHLDKDRRPVQAGFDFCLTDYSGKNSDLIIKNCKHFVEKYIDLFEPVQVVEFHSTDLKVVPFNFRSRESGLDYLGYVPESKEWIHFSLVYGRARKEQSFKSFDEALVFAFKLANKEESEDYF